ncbi:MAG: DUF433 domain-containing protein [Chloroflexota bacterium]
MNTIESIDLIIKNPAVRKGSPCLVGTTLRVTDIVIAHLFHKRSPDELASDYQISLAHIYAALAYYYQNKAMLDVDIRQQILSARQAKEDVIGGQPSLLS